MDTFSGLLDGPRARGAFLLRSTLVAPWSLRIEDEAPLTLVAIVRGSAVIVPDGGDPVPLRSGAVAVARGSAPYTVADAAITPPQVRVLPGQRCVAADGSEVSPMSSFGVRGWGNDPDGDTVMLTGTYEVVGAVSQSLLRALPPLLVVEDEACDCPLIPLLSDEIGKDLPGQEAVLDRLLDLLLISVLREWFARPDAEAPAWYRAYADPTVGGALRLMENHGAEPWTVGSLADAVHVSRATLARRFHDLVGEPPMTYLTERRIALAADLLLDPGATVGSVADAVGYSTPYSFSSAFKRVRGVSPKAHRAAQRA